MGLTKSREKIIREQKKQEILEALKEESILEKGNNFGSNATVQYLTSKYDVGKEFVKRVINLIGPQNAMLYTEFFFNSQLDKSLYLKCAEKIASGEVNIKELGLKRSSLDLFVQDEIQRFNLTKKQLEQTEYRKRNPETGTFISRENPYHSTDCYEHLDTMILDKDQGPE